MCSSDLWENGYLGYPITDEVLSKEQSYQNFQGGTVYWSFMTGAHDVRGAIRDRYVAWGAENWGLGLPTSDETPLRGGAYQLFWNASIYWSPATGAHVVRRSIRDTWAGLGWENGPLGYPVADEVSDGLTTRQDFVHGSITFDGRKRQATVTYR